MFGCEEKMDNNTKEKIIDKALDYFFSLGYDKTSLNMIAKDLGITKGGLYHHFASKEELFKTCLERVLAELDRWFHDNLVGVSDIRELLKNYIHFPAFFKKGLFARKGFLDPNFYRMMFDALDQFDDLKAMVEGAYGEYLKLLSMRLKEGQDTGVIRADIDVELFSIQLTTMVEGMILFAVMSPGLSLGEKTDGIFENIWQMIQC